MTMKSDLIGILAGSLLTVSFVAAAEDSIVVDPNTGDYIITYRIKRAGETTRVVFVPATKIDPGVKWDIKISGNKPDVFLYRYRFKNGHTSRQYLEGARLTASNAIPDSATPPAGWDSTVYPDSSSSTSFVSWFFKGNDIGGLKIGTSLGGFEFKSMDLPGVGDMEFFGSAPAGQAFPGEGPRSSSPIRAQFDEITDHNFVSRNSAVPRINVPSPFDAAVVLTGMQKHVNQDLITMKLIDPAFASQLDSLFQNAISAAKGGNTVALKGNLKDLRRLLKSEHADVDKDDEDWDKEDDGKDKKNDKTRLIDKLAAKVLDFDVKYILKHLENKD